VVLAAAAPLLAVAPAGFHLLRDFSEWKASVLLFLPPFGTAAAAHCGMYAVCRTPAELHERLCVARAIAAGADERVAFMVGSAAQIAAELTRPAGVVELDTYKDDAYLHLHDEDDDRSLLSAPLSTAWRVILAWVAEHEKSAEVERLDLLAAADREARKSKTKRAAKPKA
jgi:hypothetical protein